MSLRSMIDNLFGDKKKNQPPELPSSGFSRTVNIGTDVAAFLIFHPDDLVHRSQDPIAWYSYGFAYQYESAAGRLVGFSTNSDGGYRIRLTTGTLTAAEMAAAGNGWAYPLEVRHGTVYLDNSDGLPGVEQMDNPADFPDRWFPLENGGYRVDIYPILRSDNDDETLPDYVIRFTPADPSSIPAADNLPDLRCLPGWQPCPSPKPEIGYGLWPKTSDQAAAYPILAVETVPHDLIPGQSVSVEISEEMAEVLREDLGEFRILSWGRPDLAALVCPHSLSGSETTSTLGIHVMALVRPDAPNNEGFLPFETYPKPDMTASPEALEELRAAVRRAREQGRITPSFFEWGRFEALNEAEPMTTWAILHSPVIPAKKPPLYLLNAESRIKELLKVLA